VCCQGSAKKEDMHLSLFSFKDARMRVSRGEFRFAVNAWRIWMPIQISQQIFPDLKFRLDRGRV
jgi:hypothetical protein